MGIFYDRYEELCRTMDLKPKSQKAADLFGVTKATISLWGSKGNIPSGSVVKIIADTFDVSTDYLLGRTDDPINYADPDLSADLSGAVLDDLYGDIDEALMYQKAVEQDVKNEIPRIMTLYRRLNKQDKMILEAYAEGLLAHYPKEKRQITAS